MDTKIIKTFKFSEEATADAYVVNAEYLDGKSSEDFAPNTVATTGNNGLMSWEDKTKLNNLPTIEEIWIFDCGTATTVI